MWDEYVANSQFVYPGGPSRGHLKKLIELFVPCSERDHTEKIAVDVGCGTGVLFPFIIKKIKPKRIDGIDWSRRMLEKSKEEILRLQKGGIKTNFNLYCLDISTTPLPYPDNFVDVVISNLVICYIPGGWEKCLIEFSRILRNKGYLYLGTLLNTWTFRKVPLQGVKNPIQARKYRQLIAQISREAKKQGAEFPSSAELIGLLRSLKFKDIKVNLTFHGNGLVLRAKK